MTDSPVTDSPVAESPVAESPVAESTAPESPTPEGSAPESPTPKHSGDDAAEGPASDGATTAQQDPDAEPGALTPGDVASSAPAHGGDDAAEDDAAGDDAAGDDAAGDDAAGDDAAEDPLESEGEVAADYLEELLDIADLDGDIDTYVESGRAHVSIVTTSDTLVGRDGQVLEALQELARLAVVTSTGRRSRLMLDVAGHRERRRQELTSLADDAIAEARESKEPVRLAPMNPYERKIVHDVVAAAGLTSESEGEEPRRRVVVLP